MVARTRVHYILWRQDLSLLKPPVVLSGLIDGHRALTRYSGHHAATTIEALAARLRHETQPQPSLAAPVSVENASEAAPFLSFTPCDTFDVASLLSNRLRLHPLPTEGDQLERAAKNCRGDGAGSEGDHTMRDDPNTHQRHLDSCVAARPAGASAAGGGVDTADLIRDTLSQYLDTLAAVESLETGVPVRYTESALRDVLACLSSLPQPPPVSSTTPSLDRHVRAPSVVLLTTPAHFSLACGLGSLLPYFTRQRTAPPHQSVSSSPPRSELATSSSTSSLVSPTDVVWCPSVSASLSAQWWMFCLRETHRQTQKYRSALETSSSQARQPPCAGALSRSATGCDFHTLLLADPFSDATHAIALLRTLADERAWVNCVAVHGAGLTPAAARRQRRHLAVSMATPAAPASLMMTNDMEDVPSVTLVMPPRAMQLEKARAAEQTDPSHDSVPYASLGDVLFDCGMCPAPPKLPFLSPSSTASATTAADRHEVSSTVSRSSVEEIPAREDNEAHCGRLCDHRRRGRGRCALVMLPDSCAMDVLGRLVRGHLGGAGGTRHVVGHSLDASVRIGPLHSAAHLDAAKTLLERSTAVSGKAHTAVSATKGEEEVGEGRRRPIVWQHVTGGFVLPLTVTTTGGGGYYWLPAVLYASLASVRRHAVSQAHLHTTRVTGAEGHVNGEDRALDEAAIRAVCESVSTLSDELEACHDGLTGAALFVCSYPSHMAQENQRCFADVAARVAHSCDMELRVLHTHMQARHHLDSTEPQHGKSSL